MGEWVVVVVVVRGGGRHATCTVLIDEFVFPRNVKAPKQETKADQPVS